MAKKILHSDIIEQGNPAIDTLKGLEMLQQQIVALRTELKKTKTELNKTFTGAEDVKRFSAAEQKASEITKKKTAADKLAETAARSLASQRQRGLAAMAKQEASERELQQAAFGEARSLEQLEKKVRALITIRKRLDLSTRQGVTEHRRLTTVIEQGTRALRQQDAQIGIHNRNVGNYKSALQGLRSSFMATTAAITGVVIALKGMFNIYSANIKLYNEAAKAESKVRTAVTQTGKAAGYTAEQLKRIASELQSVTLFDDDTILNEVTAQLLSFPNITGEAFERAQMAALDLATMIDKDLMSTTIQLGKALANPVKGIAALSKSGVLFTEEQKNMIKQLVESNRLFDAQSLILDTINEQYKDQARNIAKVGTGPMVQLKNAWGDLREEIGESTLVGADFSRGLTTVLKSVTTILNEDTIPAWRKFIALAAAWLPANRNMAAEIDAKNKALEAEAAAMNVSVKSLKEYRDAEEKYNESVQKVVRAKFYESKTGVKNTKQLGEAEKNLDENRNKYFAAGKKMTKEKDDAAKKTQQITKAQIKLIDDYNEATGEELTYTKASLAVAQEWLGTKKDETNAIERLQKEISNLETAMNLAVLAGKPLDKILDRLIPKKQELQRMEDYSKFVLDLALLVANFDTKTEIQPGDKGIARLVESIHSEAVDQLKMLNEKDPFLKYLYEARGEVTKIELDDVSVQLKTDVTASAAALKDKGGIEGLKQALGLENEDVDEIKKAVGVITSEFEKLFASRKEMAEEAYKVAKDNTDQTIELLQLEYEKREQGLANNTAVLETTLSTQKRLQAEALEEQKKASIVQLRMNQLETLSSMVLATANVFKENSKLGPFGVAAGIIQVAAMLGSFVGFQQQIKSLKMEQGGRFTEGDRGVIIGDRHSAASGGERLSDQIQAEDGEKVYVLSRKHSKSKEGKLMDSVFDRIQRGEDLSVNSLNKVILPRVSILQQPDTGWMQVVLEQRNTNRLLGRMKHYNPVTKTETDLRGNSKIYH